MRLIKHANLFVTLTLVAGCTGSSSLSGFESPPVNGERMNIDVAYYNVNAINFKQLNREIALHGPTVQGVGKAIAATNIRMNPDIKFRQVADVCIVARSKISVNAKVTLPRLQNSDVPGNKITKAFDNLESYARLHEAVHVSIAEKYAESTETKISQLEPRANCRLLEKAAVNLFKAEMKAHEKAQLDFDRDEKKRFSIAKLENQ